MTTTSRFTLELLLSDPFENRPTLENGLPELAAGLAPRPEKVPRGVDSGKLEAPGADPNILSLQRWGIIIPRSEAGERALEQIEPLRTFRQAEQDAEVRVFRVEPGMGLQEAFNWRNDVLFDEKTLPEADRPKYLLILGDLDEVSAELGHVLANGSFVGRLHFDDPAGYRAYAEKVVRWEKEPSSFEQPTAQFFVSNDGTSATRIGKEYLIDPCLELARRKGRNPLHAQVEQPWADVNNVEDFIGHCNQKRPSVLLSVCHGAGRPANRDWASVDEQRQFQGALGIIKGGHLTAAIAKGKPFLPGGLWFALACFSAGTPATSEYYAWLATLEEAGGYKNASRVLRSLPKKGEKPFIAALPKVVLANPDGPLGVIGHLDLAWTVGFMNQNQPGQSQPARIFSSLKLMADGSRVGVAYNRLMSAYITVNDELLSDYKNENEAQVLGKFYKVDGLRRANLFMLRNDLRGYVLLGDPAARLPLMRKAEEKRPARSHEVIPSAEPQQAPGAAQRRAEEMEKAVLAVLAKEGTTKEITTKYGTTREELEKWVERYKTGGRIELGKI